MEPLAVGLEEVLRQRRRREEAAPVALALVGELALGRAVARDAARELVVERRAVRRLQPVVTAENCFIVFCNALAPRVQDLCGNRRAGIASTPPPRAGPASSSARLVSLRERLLVGGRGMIL